MSRQEIKRTVREAIESETLKDDILKVSLFGSYLHGDFSEDSDIDVLIEFDPTAHISFFNLARIKRHIEQFTNKPVDLLTPEAISRFFRDQIINEAETVYER
jgi:predicted nucleotidyltransferase